MWGDVNPDANPFDLENERELEDIDMTEDTWE
jgi:hypothetical protein